MFDYERRINMNLFKKKEKKECCCSQIDQESIIKAEESKKEDGIKILGSGCKKCEKLEESVKKAVIELNLNFSSEKQANHISNNWKKNASHMYAEVINLLTTYKK